MNDHFSRARRFRRPYLLDPPVAQLKSFLRESKSVELRSAVKVLNCGKNDFATAVLGR